MSTTAITASGYLPHNTQLEANVAVRRPISRILLSPRIRGIPTVVVSCEVGESDRLFSSIRAVHDPTIACPMKPSDVFLEHTVGRKHRNGIEPFKNECCPLCTEDSMVPIGANISPLQVMIVFLRSIRVAHRANQCVLQVHQRDSPRQSPPRTPRTSREVLIARPRANYRQFAHRV